MIKLRQTILKSILSQCLSRKKSFKTKHNLNQALSHINNFLFKYLIKQQQQKELKCTIIKINK